MAVKSPTISPHPFHFHLYSHLPTPHRPYQPFHLPASMSSIQSLLSHERHLLSLVTCYVQRRNSRKLNAEICAERTKRNPIRATLRVLRCYRNAHTHRESSPYYIKYYTVYNLQHSIQTICVYIRAVTSTDHQHDIIV